MPKGTQMADLPNIAEHQIATFLADVGTRVRKERGNQGLTRKALSEKSGVSQRYLAQLETGAGNISIGLLQRIAVALDHRIEWFVGEEDPWTLAAFDHTGNNDVITIINPNTKHGTRISDLSAGDKDIVMNKLNEWLNLSD